MSNNARVVPKPSGGWWEIGRAQYFQVLAARASTDVRMNPVLLKPKADTPTWDHPFDRLADHVAACFPGGWLQRLAASS